MNDDAQAGATAAEPLTLRWRSPAKWYVTSGFVFYFFVVPMSGTWDWDLRWWLPTLAVYVLVGFWMWVVVEFGDDSLTLRAALAGPRTYRYDRIAGYFVEGREADDSKQGPDRVVLVLREDADDRPAKAIQLYGSKRRHAEALIEALHARGITPLNSSRSTASSTAPPPDSP